MKSYHRELHKLASEHGCEIERGAKHFKLKRGGNTVATASVSPSCYHAVKNLRRDLARLQGLT